MSYIKIQLRITFGMANALKTYLRTKINRLSKIYLQTNHAKNCEKNAEMRENHEKYSEIVEYRRNNAIILL